jgi:hypothetical protein
MSDVGVRTGKVSVRISPVLVSGKSCCICFQIVS